MKFEAQGLNMIHYHTIWFQLLILGLCNCLDTISIKTHQNISDRENDVLVSSRGNFALGFFSPGKSNYRYVGIWYHKIPEQTVVWVANRDNPINDSSGVLSADATNGNLVLYKTKTEVVWSTNPSSGCSPASECVAQLLDSGNFVLLHNITKHVVWQSFDHLTNTRISGMKIGINKKTGASWSLTSWKSEDDPGSGNYSYRIEPSGLPQLILYEGGVRMWRAGHWNGIRWSGIPAIPGRYIFHSSFVNNNIEISQTLIVFESSILSRFILNESGMVQMFLHNEGDDRWNEIWSAPRDLCDQYDHCGVYGVCDSSIAEVFECTCLPGFEPKSPADWYLRDAKQGCIRKPGSLICREGEGFVKLENIKVPDTSNVQVSGSSLSLKECEKECLRNCNCTAYTSANVNEGGRGCILWHTNLTDTRKFPADGGQDFYIRVDKHELVQYAKKSKGMNTLIILVVSGASILFFLNIFSAYWFLMRKREGQRNLFLDANITREECSKGKKLEDIKTHPDLPFFDLRTLIRATDNFSAINRLGEGGFGSVYKGQLANGQEIAVKRLSKHSGQGMEEFKNEVTMIAKLQHRNLVRLFGCCIHKEEKMLVYEYMPNKSLDYFIFDATRKSQLDWTKRFDIIVGIARGILYLHQDSRLKIIHRDLKASNVLLDASMNPKISDFGMARMFGEDQIQAKTRRVVGTYGYMSPEYAMQGLYSTKSDVFSFGVLLLEIISGRKNTNYIDGSSSPNLIAHIWELWKEGRVVEIVDPTLCHSFSAENEVSKYIHIGLLCVQERAADRPTMSAVVFMLANGTSLPLPKTPAFVFEPNTFYNPNISKHVSLNNVTITSLEAR